MKPETVKCQRFRNVKALEGGRGLSLVVGGGEPGGDWGLKENRLESNR